MFWGTLADSRLMETHPVSVTWYVGSLAISENGTPCLWRPGTPSVPCRNPMCSHDLISWSCIQNNDQGHKKNQEHKASNHCTNLLGVLRSWPVAAQRTSWRTTRNHAASSTVTTVHQKDHLKVWRHGAERVSHDMTFTCCTKWVSVQNESHFKTITHLTRLDCEIEIFKGSGTSKTCIFEWERLPIELQTHVPGVDLWVRTDNGSSQSVFCL